MANEPTGAPTGDTPVDPGATPNPAPTDPAPSPAPTDPAPAPAPTDPAPAPAPTDPAPSPAPTDPKDPAPTDPKDPVDPTPDPNDPATAWKEKLAAYAGDDEKLAKRLGRYGSVEAALDALVAAQNKIAQGFKPEKPGKDASPEELSAWREANGLPEDPTGYKIELPDDVIMGEADKPVVDDFLKVAHEMDLPGEDVNKMLGWYFQSREAEINELMQGDVEVAGVAEAELRKEFGQDFELNKNLLVNWLETAPPGVKDLMMGARLADGTPMMSHVGALRFMIQQAREANPTATVVPGAGMQAAQSITAELDKYNGMMKDTKSEYWTGPNAARHQERYRKLIDAQQKYEAKA